MSIADKFPFLNPLVRANIRWLGKHEGGREDIPWEGYRIPIYLESHPRETMSALWDVIIMDISTDERTRRSEIIMMYGMPQAPHHLLVPGEQFTLREGRDVTATGVIIEPVDKLP